MKQIVKLSAIALLSPLLFNLSNPKSARAENQFDICIREMVNSGVEFEKAHTACADALIPKELSFCVAKITNDTPISAEDAVTNCYQVRRPIDLSYCVVDINDRILRIDGNRSADGETDKSPLMLALESCRASLSPARHSECVIALSRTPEAMSPVKAINSCLSAEDYPKALFPAY